MKKRIALIVALVALVVSIVALVVANGHRNAARAAEMRQIINSLKEFDGVVSWVYDGDTVQIKSHGVKILARVWGIDTPEKKQPGGKDALWYLVRMAKGKKVRVVPVESGKYGRLIAKLYVKDKFVNLEMVKAGHAWWYKHFSPEWKAGEEAQAEARAAKRGIWGAETPPINPYKWRKTHKRYRRRK